LVSTAVCKVEETPRNFVIPSGYAGGYAIFLLPPIERRELREVSLFEIILLTCPSTRFLKDIQQNVAFKLPTLKIPL
jgi:hypothetical protein